MPLTAEDIRQIIRETVPDAVRETIAEEGGAGGPSPSDWRKGFTPGPSRRKRGYDPENNPAHRGLRAGALVLAMAHGKGDPDRAAAYIERWYEQADAEPILRALAAGSAVDGGFLIEGDVSAEIIELLRPASVIRGMNPVMMPMPNGTIRVRKLAGGSSASYSGENEDISASQPEFGELVLTARKLTALVPISNDLVRAPSAGAEGIVRDDVVQAMALRGDLAMLRGDGLDNTPKGLRHWALAPNVFAARATVNLDNVTADLRDAVNALESADVRMIRPGWLMAPRTKNYLMTVRDGNGNFAFRDEMRAGRLWEFPFATTTQIPTNLNGNESELYLVDFADAVIGEQEGVILDVSSEASYIENGNLVSAFSRDQTVIRAIGLHDFGMRHDASIVVVTGVTWGAGA
jgi:HK97 family phage major capsid protein